MLITTAPARPRAASTKRRCPSCRYPIVGTRPTRRPAARSARTHRRRSGMVLSSIMPFGWKGSAGRDSLEAVLGAGIPPVPHLGGVAADRGPDGLAQSGIPLEKLGIESLVEAEHVVQHEDLSVTAGTGPDPDGRDGERGRDPPRERRREQLQHDGAGAGLLQRV